MLTPRWTPLRPHLLQSAYFRSKHRFNMVPAGRRSGKTELAKRKVVRAALRGTKFDNARFFAAAPTRDQAKRIYWNDLKALVPREFMGRPSEGDLIIPLINGNEIFVVGMDKPERIEGQPWDGGILDEYGNMKEKAWPENVRPALSDRLGWCDFIGVPEGRNHYFDLYEKAKAQLLESGDASQWGVFEWESATVLSAEELASAKADLHPLVFEQEYGGKFVDFSGVAILDVNNLLDNGEPVSPPLNCDAVFAVVDSATKTGKENDGTAVVFFALKKSAPRPLFILDWDIVQIEGALLETWLPTVFQRSEALARSCGSRSGALPTMIEDKSSGMVLLQHARRRNWPAREIPSAMTAIGKSERAISVSGYVYTGKVGITREAYEKKVVYKGDFRNHLWRQIADFRVADKDAANRADDLLDCTCYGIALSLGNKDGY